MEALNNLCNPWDMSYMFEAIALSKKYEEDGWKDSVLHKMTLQAYHYKKFKTTDEVEVELGLPLNIFIDDLGLEKPVMHKGRGVIKSKMTDVVAEILHHRYNKFEKMGARVFATTNLSDSQIYSTTSDCRYDARTYSRIKGLMDFIGWGAEENVRDYRIEPNLKQI